MGLTLGSRTVGVSLVVDVEGKEVVRRSGDVGRDLLVKDGLAIRVDLDVGVLEPSDSSHRTEVVVAGGVKAVSVPHNNRIAGTPSLSSPTKAGADLQGSVLLHEEDYVRVDYPSMTVR